MHNDNNVNQSVEAKQAWQRPTVRYIDIKRTMSQLGGSTTDTLFTGNASTDQI